MTVATETYGYDDKCCLSHEFLRRGCSVTPMSAYWAGDLIVTTEILTKQSEVNDMRGGDCETNIEYPKQNNSCSDLESGIPGQYTVEATSIRDGEENSFQYLIPKAENPENEHNWSLGLYQSNDECGKMMDGGDAYQDLSVFGRVMSICGSINQQIFNPSVHFLDNRKSLADDPDNGLLFAIRNGLTGNWEVRYAPVERNLTAGLMMSDDVTAAFRAALAGEGMTDDDVFEFGMI